MCAADDEEPARQEKNRRWEQVIRVINLLTAVASLATALIGR